MLIKSPFPDVPTSSPLWIMIQILVVIGVTLIVNKIIRASIRMPHILETRRRQTYLAVIKNVISFVLFFIALYCIFIILRINLVPLLASAGIIGIAIGIGTRPLVEDLISGIFLITQGKIALGDYIATSNDIEGTIEDIGVRTLTLRAKDGSLIIVPNGLVRHVVNYSRGKAVVFVDIPVKAGQKVDYVRKVLKEILDAMKQSTKFNIAAESKVFGVQNIATGSALVYRVILVTTPSKRESIAQEYRTQVVKNFAKHKLSFA